MCAKNEISSRFIEAYEKLLKSGDVADKKDFAGKLNISASMITEISKGRSSVGTSAIQNIVSIFGVSADWLITGRGSVFYDNKTSKEDVEESLPNIISVSSADESIIYKMYKEKDLEVKDLMETIGSLRERIRQLEREKDISALDVQDSIRANAG